MRTVCENCKSTWDGSLTCHCNRCHNTFADIKAFDSHLDRRAKTCRSPQSVGLVRLGRKYSCYGGPADSDLKLIGDEQL